MTRPSWIGQTLGGRYRIDDILGQGGMSAVYKAYDPNLKRVVAVKLIHSHLADDPRFLVRFEEEAAAVAQLRHPNIVQVFDFNHDQDVYYMVQEFVAGETLQEILRRLNKTDRRMSLKEALGYVINICDAAGYAHQRGLIHRDIKPANIMVNVHGQAILMDFGIVKITGGEKHTATGAVVGTALYLAPEAIRGEVPDARSDLYALGVTLFEMVSGRPPFEADSAMSLMMMHLNDPLPDLRSLRADIPPALVKVIEKALAKEREGRYGSMAEFAAALRGVLGGLEQAVPLATQADDPLPAVPIPTLTPAPRPDYAAEPNMAPVEAAVRQPAVQELKAVPAAKKSGKLPLYAGIGVGSFAILAVLIAVLVLRPGKEDQLNALPSPSATTAPLVVLLPEATATLPATPTATLTSTQPPIQVQLAAPSSTPSLTPTIPVGVAYARINGISLDAQGKYVVDYETFEFTEMLPGQHVHFFFNSVKPEQAGLPASGPWILYGGPRPFSDYGASDRPPTATQMCVLVANADHSVRQNSGNCYTLPDVTAAVPVFNDPCLSGPGTGYPVLGQLKAGQVLLVTALSPDEAWWTVDLPDSPGTSCWLQRSRADFSGDISTLPMADVPALPEGSAANLAVVISRVTLNEQGQYVVVFSTSGFTPALPGTHLHFFFDIFASDQLSGTGSNRLMYAGASPFTGYTQLDRPQNATQLCALVANPDHTVIPGSGNCSLLP